jgi:hypothetical protein
LAVVHTQEMTVYSHFECLKNTSTQRLCKWLIQAISQCKEPWKL